MQTDQAWRELLTILFQMEGLRLFCTFLQSSMPIVSG